MKTNKSFPTLYSLSSTGKVKQWSIEVIQKLSGVLIRSSHGYLGQTITEEDSSIIKGKNLGRKNETTPLEQAYLEAESKWKKKLDKNYTETIPPSIEAFPILLPMLAHKLVDKHHYIEYPCYVQPKLNGIRALSEKRISKNLSSLGEVEIEFHSRGGKTFEGIPHLTKALSENHNIPLYPILDGEIFTTQLTFQEIISAVKKEKENTSKLEFWIFDTADTNIPFEERLEFLNSMFKNIPVDSPLKLVPTYVVHNERELMEHHKMFSITHEGTIIRNRKGMYIFDYRSTDLIKHKDFIVDEEFLIIGGKEASGNDAGTVVFRCVTQEGKEFDVRPTGTREQRKVWFDNLHNLINKKKLTVTYQNLSDEGIPIFPVGAAIRDYE